jgi:hypothetical protein
MSTLAAVVFTWLTLDATLVALRDPMSARCYDCDRAFAPNDAGWVSDWKVLSAR